MPIYEYQCESCGKISERIDRVSEEGNVILGRLAECGCCGKLCFHRKLVSTPSFKVDGYSAKNGYSKTYRPLKD